MVYITPVLVNQTTAVLTIPSYIKDSSHLISLGESAPFPSNAILVTINVAMYPAYRYIPQDEAIKLFPMRLPITC